MGTFGTTVVVGFVLLLVDGADATIFVAVAVAVDWIATAAVAVVVALATAGIAAVAVVAGIVVEVTTEATGANGTGTIPGTAGVTADVVAGIEPLTRTGCATFAAAIGADDDADAVAVAVDIVASLTEFDVLLTLAVIVLVVPLLTTGAAVVVFVVVVSVVVVVDAGGT